MHKIVIFSFSIIQGIPENDKIHFQSTTLGLIEAVSQIWNDYDKRLHSSSGTKIYKVVPRNPGIPGNDKISFPYIASSTIEAVRQIGNDSDKQLHSWSVHKIVTKYFLEIQEY